MTEGHAVWEVEAIRCGSSPSRPKSAFYLAYAAYGEPDAPQGADYWFYVLRSGDRVVAVDTGPDAGRATRRGRTVSVDPAPFLAGLGVDTLVLTHLHYDHIGNVAAVGEVPIVVPATEFAFWRSPVARRAPYWVNTDPEALAALDAADAAGRVTTYAGAHAVAPGITAFEVGGHAPGQSVVLVEGPERPVLLASDAVHLYEELELHRPIAIVDDLQKMYAAFEFIDALAAATGAVVVPAHDPLVAERFGPGTLGEHAFRLA